MELKRICRGVCRQYRVKKPAVGGRYLAGQARCQTCDVWIDRQGVHLLGGKPAMDDSSGWFCNCCNYRVRRHPRNTEYKSKFRNDISRTSAGRDKGAGGKSPRSKETVLEPAGAGADSRTRAKRTSQDAAAAAATAAKSSENAKKPGAQSKAQRGRGQMQRASAIDLDYFNKTRALMLREIGAMLAGAGGDAGVFHNDIVLSLGWTSNDIEIEFDTDFENIVGMAVSDEPNKISMICEFERVRAKMGRTPTKRDMQRHAKFKISHYNDEFKSWGHFLDRLGYDPWYRN